jgi:hypothetical protein
MRAFAAILIAIICVGCAITREQAVAVATRAIVERKLPLPARYTVSVTEGSFAPEPGAPSTLWGVEFRVQGRTEPEYTVWVQKSSGTLEGFTDYTTLEKPASVHDR